MAITLAAQGEANGYGTSLAISHTATAGKLLVVFFSSSGGPTVTVTDNGGNVWTKVGDTLDSGATAHSVGQVFYTFTTAAVSTITLSRTGNTNWTAKVTQWTGATAFVGSDLTVQPDVATVGAVANDLIIGGAFYYGSSGPSAPSGWTGLTTSARNSAFIVASAYKLATAAGAQGPSWTTGATAGLFALAFREGTAPTFFRYNGTTWVPQLISMNRT